MAPIQVDARTVDVLPEGPFHRVVLDAPPIANRLSPGQFVTADLGEPVRAPLLPADITAGEINVLLPGDHAATSLQQDHVVNLIGPLGTKIEIPHSPARLLLIADGAHLPALLFIAHRALGEGCPVTLLLRAATPTDLYPPALLPTALEVHIDHEGDFPGPIPDLLLWADRVLVATDPASYLVLSELIRDTRLLPPADFAQALVMPTIVCGVGACRGCGVRTRKETRRACTDGPFFNLLELETQ